MEHPHFGRHGHSNQIDFPDLWYLWPCRDTTNQSFSMGMDGRKEKGSTEKGSAIQHWSMYLTTACNSASGLSVLSYDWEVETVFYSWCAIVSPVLLWFWWNMSDASDMENILNISRHSYKRISQCMFPAFSCLDLTRIPETLPSWLVSLSRLSVMEIESGHDILMIE